MKYLLVNCFFVLKFLICFVSAKSYDPTWESLDKRPLPEWYDQAKIGIFIHWGVFSVPSYHSEWFWWDWQGSKPMDDVVNFMNKNYPPFFTYGDFGKEFKAEFFNPNDWVELFKKSGAKYVVLTSKHHEGYCLWPSSNSWNWNSVDVGPNRDLVGELANAIRKNSSLRFGLYHSLYEWFNPLYVSDKKSSFKNQDFVKSKTLPELYDIVEKYQPEVIWSDGDWEAPDIYWNSKEFIAWLYSNSPVKDTVVVNDRWGVGDMCAHGDFWTCSDNYNPGKLIPHKWENCMPLDKESWGYRRNMKLTDVVTIENLISSIVQTISCGGNILLNIGPTKEGTIPPIFELRLKQMGNWLDVNGESIYNTKPWKVQNDTQYIWYTSNSNTVYGIVLKDPANEQEINLASVTPTKTSQVTMLGYSDKIKWDFSPEKGLTIDTTSINFSKVTTNWAWTFKITDVKTE